jgi:hypothetical protein
MTRSQFKVGDRIRILSIPQIVLDTPRSSEANFEDELTIFNYLLERNEVHTVVEIDPDRGSPWIEFQTHDPDGITRYHKLMIDPQCVELVHQ